MATPKSRTSRGNIRRFATRGGETHYKVRIRRQGHDLAATFTTRAAAEAWLRERLGAIAAGTLTTAPPPTVGVLFDRYRAHVLPGKAPKTRYDQGRLLSRWEAFLGPDTPLADLTPARLEDFKQRPRERGTGALSDAAIAADFRLIHHVLAYARDVDLLQANPADRVAVPTPKPRKGWLRDEEARRLLHECEEVDPRLHVLVGLCLYAGLRRSEALRLRWADVDLGPTPVLNLVSTKGDKPRSVPVVPELATLLRGRQDLLRDIGIAMLPTAPVFAEFDPRAGFEKARQRAHLPWVVLHHLRHTAGSWLGQTGASAFTIAETLGHSDIRTTQRYVHLDDATRRNALETAMKRRGRPTNR